MPRTAGMSPGLIEVTMVACIDILNIQIAGVRWSGEAAVDPIIGMFVEGRFPEIAVWASDGRNEWANSAAREVAREIARIDVNYEHRFEWVTRPLCAVTSNGLTAVARRRRRHDGLLRRARVGRCRRRGRAVGRPRMCDDIPIYSSYGVEWRRTTIHIKYNGVRARLHVVLVRIGNAVRGYADWTRGDPISTRVAVLDGGKPLPPPSAGWVWTDLPTA